MPSDVATYFNIMEKRDALADLYTNYGRRAVFIIPSSSEREFMLDLTSRGGSFFGRRSVVWTWSDLYRHIARLNGSLRRIIDPPDHKLILHYILGRLLNEKDFFAGDILPAGVTQKGFIDILGESIRTLMAEGLSPEDFQKAISEEDASPQEKILARLYNDYARYLEEWKIADSSQLFSLAEAELCKGQAATWAKAHVFIFTGFLSFTGTQRFFLNTLSNFTMCYYILPETGLNTFYDAIRQTVKGDYSCRPKWDLPAAELTANNARLEFSSIARELALWAEGSGELAILGKMNSYGDVGVLTSPERLEMFESYLRKYKIPYNEQVRGTVSDSLVGTLPKNVWRAFISNWAPSPTASLLSNPLFGCYDFDLAEAKKSFNKGSPSWKSFLACAPKTLRVFELIEKLCSDLSSGGRPHEILEFFYGFLDSASVVANISDTAGDYYDFDYIVKDVSDSIFELKKKIAILKDIGKSIGEAADIILKGADAVDYIASWCKTATLPVSLPQSCSVTIYAGIPPVLASHKFWVMTDIDYSRWPGKSIESSLLGDASRQKINSYSEDDGGLGVHIPDTGEMIEQREALFRRLTAAAECGLIIARSATDESGRPLSMSSFTTSLQNKNYDKDRRWSFKAKINYPLSKELHSSEYPWFYGAEISTDERKLDRGSFPRFIRFERGKLKLDANDKIVVSLSSLDTWIACPFKYACRYIAKLEEEPDVLYSPLAAGILTHRVWESVWKEHAVERGSLYKLVEKYWRPSVEKEYPALFADKRLIRHEKELKKQILSLALLQTEIEKRGPAKTKIWVEYTLPDFETGNVVFRGRADRIDFYADGAVILDYKLGKASNHKDELQLAAYAYIMHEQEGISFSGYGWLGHSDTSIYGYFDDESLRRTYRGENSKNLSKSAAEQIELAGRLMKEMAEAVNRGEFFANYSSKHKENTACKNCPYTGICRKRENPFFAEGTDGDDE